MIRTLLSLFLLAALAAPAWAHPGGHRGYHRGHHRAHYGCGHRVTRHHPYYRRTGYLRPYHYHRIVRTYGHAPWCGTYGHGYYTYYPRYVSVAPLYTRLSVALSLDSRAFDGPAPADKDGLPRTRTAPVGSRFLVDAR